MFRASQIYGAPPGPRGPAAAVPAAAPPVVPEAAVPSAAHAAPVPEELTMLEQPPAILLSQAPPSLPGQQQVAAALMAAAAGGGRPPQAVAANAAGGLPSFQAASAFAGARPGMVFKLGGQGLGYYLDADQTLLSEVRPKLPERWREAQLREERLRVDPAAGAGLSLEHSEFGFAVEAVDPTPGQSVSPGEVIVAMEGRLLAGLSAPQMQASFQKRRVEGARLQVASLAEVQELARRDPAIVECWDAQHQCVYYFHKRTAKTAWTREELQAPPDPLAPQVSTAAGSAATAQAAPFDIASFLSHGFAQPKEQEVKKKRKAKPEAEAEKDESDLARQERQRYKDWNDGGRGGYTEHFLARYKNCTSWVSKPKDDKRLKGSVGPGQGMEYMARWTGSKNSFN